MKLPSPFHAAIGGIALMLFAIAVNAIAYLVGITVPGQQEAVIWMLLFLAGFIILARRHRPKAKSKRQT